MACFAVRDPTPPSVAPHHQGHCSTLHHGTAPDPAGQDPGRCDASPRAAPRRLAMDDALLLASFLCALDTAVFYHDECALILPDALYQ